MTYKEALVVSFLEATNSAIDDLSESNHVAFMELQVKMSKVFKRYLDNPVVAEQKAKELGVYSIKDVDNYLKSLKEGK